MASLLRGRILLVIAATTCATLLYLCGFQIRALRGRGTTKGGMPADCLLWMPHPPQETFTEAEAPTIPTVYVVTPTYRRPTQMPDLVRVAQALMLATGVFWVLVEDSVRPTEAPMGRITAPSDALIRKFNSVRLVQVSRLLRDCGVPHVHLLGPCPRDLRIRSKGRGVSARRAALAWLQDNATLPGVLYFADDDNTYDYRLFDEIRWTDAVSVFPVGSMTKIGVSTPVVVNGSVVGFHDPYINNRSFPMDMAGFAVNLRLVINNTHLSMPHKEGRQETEFLESLNVSVADLKPLCENATKVLVWHTQSKPSVFPTTASISKKFRSAKTNLEALIRYINS